MSGKPKSMNRKEYLLLAILALIQFSHIIDFMIIMPLGKQFIEAFDISPRQFSFIVSAYAFTAFFAGLISAMFIDRHDRKKVLLILYVGFTAGTLACAAAPSYLVLLLARGLTGAFGGTLAALILSIVADLFPMERRGRAMGIIMTAFSAASVAGVPAGIFLAAAFSWHAPFLVIGLLCFVNIFVIYFALPPLRQHLESGQAPMSPLLALGAVLTNRNQLRALLFTLVLMLGHFSIIPFIAPYMQLNIGFKDHEVAYIYTLGGLTTVFSLPLFGRLADTRGNIPIFIISSTLALFSIFAITHLPPVSMALALCVTSSFFIVASGRNVPAVALVASVVRPENRGSFMSVRGSINEMALALSSLIAGLIVTQNPDGTLVNYPLVGYFAIGMSILAIFLATRLRMVA
jgi:DHA1 family inner membrane transport protein